MFRPLLGRRRALVASALLLTGTSAWLWTAPARAAGPVKYGWWTVTNAGLGFTPPAPQVPSDGLYVENGFSGPVAISAVTFQVDPGSAVGAVTLTISGTPIITSPPVACPITPAGQTYKAEQGGAWSDAPAYSCSKSQVTGQVSSNNTTVTFDAGPLLDNGTIAAVVLAGGGADQIAFNPPGPGSLSVTPPSAPTPAGGVPSVTPSGQPAGTSNGAVSTGSAAPPAPATGIAGIPPALAPGQAPAAPSTNPTSGSASRVTPRPALSAVRSAGSSVRKDLAEAIGFAALLAALVAYTEGFGLLGGRVGGARPRYPAARLSSEA